VWEFGDVIPQPVRHNGVLLYEAMMKRTGAAILPFEDREVAFEDFIRDFRWGAVPTSVDQMKLCVDEGAPVRVNTFTNAFWTAKQRAAHSLHEISYRACFKPQLPRFFIDRLTRPDDIVYDPFMGRGTTLIEAALMGRVPAGCDVNPLSQVLCEPRLNPPEISEVEKALAAVDFNDADDAPTELLVFYHPATLRQISALRKHLIRLERAAALTRADRWIRMVAVNRLTGHSPGFFSVYTLPPNQAVSLRSQTKINARLKQQPPRRDVPDIILTKTRSLLGDVTPDIRARLQAITDKSQLIVAPSFDTADIASGSIALVVTSPPFLDVVDYRTDNWPRCWFCGIDAATVAVTLAKTIEEWKAFVTATLAELCRVVRPGGYVAFEVGEVKAGTLRLEEVVVPAGLNAGLEPALVLVNAQRFTKTANCWGVVNNRKGTNSNRVVVFRRAS
jgi:hypothetical protein